MTKRDEISKTVRAGEMRFAGLFTFREDNRLVIAKRPDWVRDPVTGEKNYITDMFVPHLEFPCPKCGVVGRHGLVILKKGRIIVCCTGCRQFIWVEVKNAN